MKRDEVIRILREHRDELRERFGVSRLALFGSVARDEATETSDVDLLVDYNRPVTLFDLAATMIWLENLLGVSKVDLVPREDVYEELKERIYREAVDVVR